MSSAGSMEIDFREAGTSHSRRFNTTVYTYEIKLKNVTINEKQARCVLVIEEYFRQIVMLLFSQIPNLSDNDQVRFSVMHPNMDWPLNLPYKTKKNWLGDEITLAISKIMQSNKALRLDERFIVAIHVIKNLEGGGPKKPPKTNESVTPFVPAWRRKIPEPLDLVATYDARKLLKKRSVVTIANYVDMLCLTRAFKEFW